MDAEKSKVESLFEDVERRMGETSALAAADRRKVLAGLETALAGLTREFERFQMIGFNKYPDEIDAMEDRLGRMKSQVERMQNEDITLSAVNNEDALQKSDVVEDHYDPTQQLVTQTNAKLSEGKARALNMLKMANSMRDELNLIDDEVMLQREKLLTINNQIKHAQSVTNQTKKLVSYFTKAVNDDKIIKVMIVVVAVVLFVIIGMAVTIKRRKGAILLVKEEQDMVAQAKADYRDINEEYFYKIKLGLEKSFQGQKRAKVRAAETGVEKLVKAIAKQEGGDQDQEGRDKKTEGAAEQGQPADTQPDQTTAEELQPIEQPPAHQLPEENEPPLADDEHPANQQPEQVEKSDDPQPQTVSQTESTEQGSDAQNEGSQE